MTHDLDLDWIGIVQQQSLEHLGCRLPANQQLGRKFVSRRGMAGAPARAQTMLLPLAFPPHRVTSALAQNQNLGRMRPCKKQLCHVRAAKLPGLPGWYLPAPGLPGCWRQPANTPAQAASKT
jgi:hypothetical protein